MTKLVQPLLILLAVSALTTAWVMPSRNYAVSSSTSQLHAVPDADGRDSRRSFLLSTIGLTVITTAVIPAALAADADPFAAMDSIAEKIGSSYSNYPNSISPLPTLKETEKDLVADEDKSKEKPLDMDEALKKVRKEKKIDPRTHG
jgi:hypothetical protein